MRDTSSDALLRELRDIEYAEGYAESFLNSYVATQLKVLREERAMKQSDLAKLMGTTQTAISRAEDVNYSSWNIGTLKKFARAFKVRLHVSFETFGTLLEGMERFDRESLERPVHERDPIIWGHLELKPQGGENRIPVAAMPKVDCPIQGPGDPIDDAEKNKGRLIRIDAPVTRLSNQGRFTAVSGQTDLGQMQLRSVGGMRQ